MAEVMVIRAFCVKGARAEPGDIVDVDTMTASELVTQGRAELVGEQPASSGPLTTETAPAITKGKRKKTETEQ